MAPTQNRRTPSNRQSGFALIEALVALLVVAFGLMAIASFQYTLSGASDVAKQRTEATRIAQREMDRLRSFAQRQTDGNTSDSRYTYVDDLVSMGTPQTVTGVTTNTTYTMNRTVTVPTPAPSSGDRFRWVNIAVSWLDRAGQTQSVALNSAISDGDPSDLGTLGVQRRVGSLLRPKNRNINVPYPAVNLAGGQLSAFMPPPGNVTYIFNNATGNIVQSCTGITTLVEGMAVPTTGCTGINAYLLSGYVRFYTGNSAPSADDVINTSGNTFDLLSSGPLTISGGTPAPSAYTCYAERQLVLSTSSAPSETISSLTRAGNTVTITTARNHSFTAGMVIAVTGTNDYFLQGQFTITSTPGSRTLTYTQVGANTSDSAGRVDVIEQITLAATAPVPSAYNQTVSTFVAYACVVTPSGTGTPNEWWGQLNLVPETSSTGGRVPWTISNSGSNYTVCRYSADYNGNSALSNSEHPRRYRQVTAALDNQNFLVIPNNRSCPTDTAPTYAGNQDGDFVNTNTVAHQPTPANSAGEPGSASTAIPME
jgi:type IV pilus modification protein PilV